MKTKTIPFDAKMAKDIQDGKIKGKIKTRNNKNVRIICWDRMDTETPIVFLVQYDDWEGLYEGNSIGEYTIGYGDDSILNQLVLEVPDNDPQFKPFDKVLVRNKDTEGWQSRLYDMYLIGIGHGCQDNLCYTQCIPYKGNEYLVGTTNKPE